MPVSIPDIQTVAEIIRETARTEIMPRYKQLSAQEIKSKRHEADLVTTADIESEKRLSAEFTRLLPGSVVVGEEGAEADPGLMKALATDTPAWIIDPVDGTFNFATGRTPFVVIVAFARGGEVLAGWVHNPVTGVTSWASKGGGAWRDGERIRVAQSVPSGEMKGTGSKWLRKRIDTDRKGGNPDAPKATLHLGCTGEEYAELCRGAIHFAQWKRLKPWDHAAGILMHQEAGGFGARVEDKTPYDVSRGYDAGTILLTPDEATWDALDRYINAARHAQTSK